jgi:hypothetical protein
MPELTDREMYDRLLELAGECRHEWVEIARPWAVWSVNHKYIVSAYCNKHGEREEFYTNDPKDAPPAVGDGREMGMGEMMGLARAKRYGSIYSRWYEDDCWVDIGYDIWAHGCAGRGSGTTPELALGRAIVDAMDEK